MFDTVKNKIQRAGLINLLTHIVAGTQSAAGYSYVPKAEADKLAKAEPTFVVLDPSVKNEEGQIKATATQVAIDALSAHSSQPEGTSETTPAAAKAEPMNFEIVTLTELPPILRGGVKSDSYPFDKLNAFPEPGNSFFVPVTAARPNPAKTLASTVASATKRYANATPQRVFTVRKAMKDGKLIGAHVIRTK
jgi:hypothetical protein